jgi:hypothetical protein
MVEFTAIHIFNVIAKLHDKNKLMVTNNSIVYPSVYHGLKLAGTLLSSFLAYTLSDIFLELEKYVAKTGYVNLEWKTTNHIGLF